MRMKDRFAPKAVIPRISANRQAVVKVEELLFRGHPEVVDADLADYFGSIHSRAGSLIMLPTAEYSLMFVSSDPIW
jgi:hypothetical protein